MPIRAADGAAAAKPAVEALELEVEGTLEGLPLSEAMKESVEVILPDGTARIQRQRSH